MTLEVRHYFAYGSNMNVARATKRRLRYNQILRGKLDGFALKFNKRSRHVPVSGRANIVQQLGSTVFGVIYSLEHPADIVRMDQFEHAPVDYRRLIVEAKTDDIPVPCWTYFANHHVIDNSLLPERSYVHHLLAGREYLPKEYVFEIESVCCLDR